VQLREDFSADSIVERLQKLIDSLLGIKRRGHFVAVDYDQVWMSSWMDKKGGGMTGSSLEVAGEVVT
jgi:hypothetical protein